MQMCLLKIKTSMFECVLSMTFDSFVMWSDNHHRPQASYLRVNRFVSLGLIPRPDLTPALPRPLADQCWDFLQILSLSSGEGTFFPSPCAGSWSWEQGHRLRKGETRLEQNPGSSSQVLSSNSSCCSNTSLPWHNVAGQSFTHRQGPSFSHQMPPVACDHS